MVSHPFRVNMGREKINTALLEKIAYIKFAFNIRDVHLTEMLHVPKHVIQNWRSGEDMPSDTTRRVEMLYNAARRFREAGLRPDYNTMHRLIGGEREFIDELASTEPVGAVERLIVVKKRGENQTERLNRILKNLPDTKINICEEF